MRRQSKFVFAAASLLSSLLHSHVRAQSACVAWTDPHTALVEVSPADDLAAKVRAAAPGTTVLLSPGTYKVAAPLRFLKDDVTLRGKSGKREDVILDGDAGGGGDVSRFCDEVISVTASGITLADLS